MKINIIGGTFSDSCGKGSSVVYKLNKALLKYGIFSGAVLVNGGTLDFLQNYIYLKGDLSLWMPNIENDFKKTYPVKKKGSVLICSKVLREDRGLSDAVDRIFKMHANAVIAITPKQGFKYSFTLIDALSNIWSETEDIEQLAKDIIRFSNWMVGVERVESVYSYNTEFASSEQYKNLKDFCDINTKIADKVENCSNLRYFGNCSTRCSKLFPSARVGPSNKIYVSKRNCDKRRLSISDMILTEILDSKGAVKYYNTEKPSVDTPIQLQLYKLFPNINYMIHGHAYIESAPFTDDYFPCGDLREVWSTLKHIKNVACGAVNLKNHGFLIYAEDITTLNLYTTYMNFKNKPIGEKILL